jgi:uncharacterized membrane protein
MSEQSLIPVPSGRAGLGRGAFEPNGRQVGAGRGVDWLTQGWDLFKKNPGVWIAIVVIIAAILIFLAFIPFVGTLASYLLYPVFIGGLMLGCHCLAQGGQFGIDTLFAGFKRNTGNLVLIGVFYVVGMFVIAGVTALMLLLTAGGALLSAGKVPEGGALMMLSGAALMVVLIGLALMVPLIMAFYFAPPLVVLRDVAPFDAMKASFSACLKNFLPFLIYGVVGFVLCLIAAIPFGLGFLVLGPVLIGSNYTSYMDIFE